MLFSFLFAALMRLQFAVNKHHWLILCYAAWMSVSMFFSGIAVFVHFASLCHCCVDSVWLATLSVGLISGSAAGCLYVQVCSPQSTLGAQRSLESQHCSGSFASAAFNRASSSFTKAV